MTKKLGIFIKNTSREPVVHSFRVIKQRYLPKEKLIPQYNQLKRDAIAAIERHNDPNKNFQLRPNDVNTYVAASSLSHLLDGWGYLASAVNALLKGTSGVSIHLAYYAELRAVMSLLASEGIGVFDRKHIGLRNDTNFSVFNKLKRKSVQGQGNPLSTHIFAWEALEKYCRSEVKPSYNLLRIFYVKGFTFSELLPGFHPLATQLVSSGIAKSWLKKWAFDVKKYKNDRELRNFVSYRPQSISDFTHQIDFRTVIDNIYKLFHVLSPSIANPFEYLDLLLLKSLYDDLYQNPAISSRGTLTDLIKDSFEHVGTTLDSSSERILTSLIPNNQSHLIFSEANKLETTPLPVIARALLLLRVSTGCVSVLLKEAQINLDEMNFIWQNYGFDNGFWDNTPNTSEFHRLWDDIESEYTEIQLDIGKINNSPFSFYQEFDGQITKLSQFNRAVLWGL